MKPWGLPHQAPRLPRSSQELCQKGIAGQSRSLGSSLAIKKLGITLRKQEVQRTDTSIGTAVVNTHTYTNTHTHVRANTQIQAGLGHLWVWEVAIVYIRLSARSSRIYVNLEGHSGEGGSWVGGALTKPPNHHQGHTHLTKPREKGPEWVYVTLLQYEGMDGVKQWKNKCKLCELLHVPGCGVAKCTAAEDTWVAVDEDEERKEEGEQQEESSSTD
eukprot:1157845-Pelagomonas_calceolata.AAC.8